MLIWIVNMDAALNGVSALVAALRKYVLAILALGMAGSLTELILLKHREDIFQWIPLALLGAGLPTLLWHGASGSALSARLVRWLMYGFIAAGVAGIYFHFQGSAEFKLESQPNLRGMALFWEAIGAKAPPLLAPGALAQLGLLGLVYTYKLPVLEQSRDRGE